MNIIDKEAVFRYEHLRSYGGINGRHSRERYLFISKGLFSWMKCWAQYTKTVSGCFESKNPSRISDSKEFFDEGIHPQIIDIVTEMAIAVYGRAERV